MIKSKFFDHFSAKTSEVCLAFNSKIILLSQKLETKLTTSSKPQSSLRTKSADTSDATCENEN